jgi:hypothetical protein
MQFHHQNRNPRLHPTTGAEGRASQPEALPVRQVATPVERRLSMSGESGGSCQAQKGRRLRARVVVDLCLDTQPLSSAQLVSPLSASGAAPPQANTDCISPTASRQHGVLPCWRARKQRRCCTVTHSPNMPSKSAPQTGSTRERQNRCTPSTTPSHLPDERVPHGALRAGVLRWPRQGRPAAAQGAGRARSACVCSAAMPRCPCWPAASASAAAARTPAGDARLRRPAAQSPQESNSALRRRMAHQLDVDDAFSFSHSFRCTLLAPLLSLSLTLHSSALICQLPPRPLLQRASTARRCLLRGGWGVGAE